MSHESGIDIRRCATGRRALLHGASGDAASQIEREIFNRIIIIKTAALPASRQAGFNNKESAAAAIRCGVIEQRAQNIFLSRSRVDGGNSR
jgi:hypothetical protein